MSYMTSYYIQTRDFKTGVSLTEDERNSILEDLNMQYHITNNITWAFCEKWYECEQNMVEFSSKYPDVLFIVDAEGEDRSDMWKAYFHNCNLQLCKAEIIYEEPNLDLL